MSLDRYEGGFACRLTMCDGSRREFVYYKGARVGGVMSFTTADDVILIDDADVAIVQIGLPGANFDDEGVFAAAMPEAA